MVDISVVVGKLHDFETADAIADYFQHYGIKAMPQEARSCAISQFVQQETGLSSDDVMTTTREVNLQKTVRVESEEGTYEFQEDVWSMQHTHAMAHFVRNFDLGKYPFLVMEGYEVSDQDIDPDLYEYCSCLHCERERYYPSKKN